MNARTRQRQVAVVDLRGYTGEGKRIADDQEVEGRLIVIDDAAALRAHDEVYNAILSSPRVGSLICVATGRIDDGAGGPALVRPPTLALSRRAATLWVGDPVGVRWSPADGTARSVRGQQLRSGLDQLVAFLQEPDVFDAVLERLGALPYGTASPGLRLLFAGIDEAELAAIEPQALRTVLDEAAVSDDPGALGVMLAKVGDELGTDAVTLVPGSVLDEARAAATASLDDAELAVDRMIRLTALFGNRRPGPTVFAMIQKAESVVKQLHHRCDLLLSRMDGHLRAGDPPQDAVTALGVPEPAPVNRRDIAEALRSAVPARLAHHGSPARLLREVGQQAATIAPQGCHSERQQLDRLAPAQRPVPAFPIWPLSLSATPLIFLSCLLAAAAPGHAWQRWALAAVLAVAWFAGGWLLLARRPGEHGEAGWPASLRAAALAYGLVAVAGMVVGLVTARYLDQIQFVAPALGRFLVGIAVAALPAVLLTSWPLAARHWRRELDLAASRHTADEATQLVLAATAQRWRPSLRHRVVADALVEVGNGLEAVVRTMAGSAGTLFPPPSPDGQLPAGSQASHVELLETVVADLLDLTTAAIAPCWPAIEAGSSTAPANHADLAQRLLAQYRDHIQGHGFISPPPFAQTLAPRAALAAQIWRQAPEAVAALQARPDDEMTQLCRPADLGDISASTSDSYVVRLAPTPLRAVLDSDGDRSLSGRELHWTEGGTVAGSVRLVSIRTGAVGD